MKTSNPYGSGMDFKVTPKTIESDISANSKKAKARFIHKPLATDRNFDSSNMGKMKRPGTKGVDF